MEKASIYVEKKKETHICSQIRVLIALGRPIALHQQLSSVNVDVCWLAESKNDFNDLERKSKNRGPVIKRPCIIGLCARKHKSLSHNVGGPVAETLSRDSACQLGKGQRSSPAHSTLICGMFWAKGEGKMQTDQFANWLHRF